jgi:hypothetical protein
MKRLELQEMDEMPTNVHLTTHPAGKWHPPGNIT